MNTKLKEAMREQMLMLPKETQEAINAFDWLGEADKIGRGNDLTDNGINDFQTETALVLGGLTDPAYFAQKIENEIGLTKEEAKKIADEAMEKIFTPIANKAEESIKEKLKNKNPKWDQNVKFALSGGDYSFFAERAGTTNVLNPSNPQYNPSPARTTVQSGGQPPLVRGGAMQSPPDKGDLGGLAKSKVEDLRSKFTI